MSARRIEFEFTAREKQQLREETAQAVCHALASHGATFEYPGYINLPDPKHRGGAFAFGTANGYWGGDLSDWAARNIGGYDLQISQDSMDVNAIVKAILDAIERS